MTSVLSHRQVSMFLHCPALAMRATETRLLVVLSQFLFPNMEQATFPLSRPAWSPSRWPAVLAFLASKCWSRGQNKLKRSPASVRYSYWQQLLSHTVDTLRLICQVTNIS